MSGITEDQLEVCHRVQSGRQSEAKDACENGQLDMQQNIEA